jgi:hypothetical protein
MPLETFEGIQRDAIRAAEVRLWRCWLPAAAEAARLVSLPTVLELVSYDAFSVFPTFMVNSKPKTY